MTLTAADLFAVNDGLGDLSFTVTGTPSLDDTLNLSAAEGWATSDGGSSYTATGNFDGVDGDETYTINVSNTNVIVA
jgi:hypothetical protein